MYSSRSQLLALILAASALVINFWAWFILSPLASHYSEILHLSPVALSVLLAVPIIIGSLGRVPVGMLSDKFGGARMMAILSFISILPLFTISASSTYPQLLASAFFLGIAGTSFAAGIPYVSSWFKPEQRGFVLGLFGMGNIGTALVGFVTPRIFTHFGIAYTFIIPAIGLGLIGLILLVAGKNAPDWIPTKNPVRGVIQALTLPATRYLSLMYIITFGGFIAFGVYLPTLLSTSYHLTVTDATTKAAGFVGLVILAWPLGGWLSDKIGSKVVLRTVFLAITVLAIIGSLPLPLMPFATIAYLSLAFTLGMGNGAIFSLLGRTIEPAIMGSVAGIVGAVGGLGGFFPPLILGVTYQTTNSYAIALLLLAVSSLIVIWLANPFLNEVAGQ